jgi:hypothetical protein
VVVRERVRKEWVVHLTVNITEDGLKESERISERKVAVAPSEWI